MAWVETYRTKQGLKRRVRWQVGSKKGSKSAGTLKDTAILVRNQVEADLIRGSVGAPDLGRTVVQLIEEYKEVSARKDKPKTGQLKAYCLEKLSDFFKDRKLISVQPSDLEHLKNALLKERSLNGTKIILRTVRAAFAYGVKMRYVPENPARNVDDLEANPVARFLNTEEVFSLIEASRFSKGLREIITVALHTGMRKGEILGIKKENIKDGMIYLEQTKTGQRRKIPIHSSIVDILKKSPGFLGWNDNRLNLAFRRAVKRAKIGRVRFHDLRHTFCSQYLRAGGTIADLREISGHKSLAALQVYAHFQPSDLKRKIEAVSYGGILGEINDNSANGGNPDSL